MHHNSPTLNEDINSISDTARGYYILRWCDLTRLDLQTVVGGVSNQMEIYNFTLDCGIDCKIEHFKTYDSIEIEDCGMHFDYLAFFEMSEQTQD